jgi:hypothetical protein
VYGSLRIRVDGSFTIGEDTAAIVLSAIDNRHLVVQGGARIESNAILAIESGASVRVRS